MRLKIILAYVGTAYAGWQRQDRAPSVQGAVEAAAGRVADAPITVYGAGRTDAGVHARGQVAHLEVTGRLSPEEWRGALNAYLPDDIRVLTAEPATPDFHARHQARGKTYRYELDLGVVASPFSAPFAWHVGPDLDPDVLERASTFLLGRLDQRGFATKPQDTDRVNRPLREITVEVDGERVAVTVSGRSFLRYAVRGMVGSLVEVARGRREPATLRAAAETGDRTLAGATAPAHGLCLMAVHYR